MQIHFNKHNKIPGYSESLPTEYVFNTHTSYIYVCVCLYMHARTHTHTTDILIYLYFCFFFVRFIEYRRLHEQLTYCNQ